MIRETTSSILSVAQEWNEMHVAFVYDEQRYGPFAVDFYHTTCFFENSCYIEVSCNDLVSLVTAVGACTDTDEVDNASPVISKI